MDKVSEELRGDVAGGQLPAAHAPFTATPIVSACNRGAKNIAKSIKPTKMSYLFGSSCFAPFDRFQSP
jgi:hypothetical protein